MKVIVPVLLILFLAAFVSVGVMVSSTIDITQNSNDTNNGALASMAGISDDNNGGGGGAPSAPSDEGDDGCVGECPSVWIDDVSSKSGTKSFFGFFIPLLSTGHWECDGVCADKSQLCMFNPTDVMPTGWETNPDFPPECTCLEPKPGYCSFYDANYGVGDQNIICGGDCGENGMCMRSTFEDKDVCRCMLSYDSDECGLHAPEQYLQSTTGEYVKPDSITEDDCYGKCTVATACTFSYLPGVPTDTEIPECYCPESQEQEQEQEQEIIYCESIHNPESQKDCDVGKCTVLMYGVECTYHYDENNRYTWCSCDVPEDKPIKTSSIIITDKLLGTIYDKFV